MSYALTLFICSLVIVTAADGWPIHSNGFRALREVFALCNSEVGSRTLCPELPPTCCCAKKKSWMAPQPNVIQGTQHEKGLNSETQSEHVVFCTEILNIPPILSNPAELILHKTYISSLNTTSFNSTQLTKVTLFKITNDRGLKRIGSHAFSGLRQLRQIYIDLVENLESISESAFSGLPKLKQLIIKGTGLKRVEGFGNLQDSSDVYLTIILSDNQRLERIQTNAFHNLSKRVTVIEMRWNPMLSIVENYAFNGSSVDIIILADNSALTTLSPLAFAGIESLRNLSFDNTPVYSLPTVGLEQLKELKARGVPNMVRFPASSELPSLQEALLTYPYHCCALNPNNGYGFGQVYLPYEHEEPQTYDCDTGAIIPPDEYQWSTESQESYKTPKMKEYPEESSHHENMIIDIVNGTDLFGEYPYEDSLYNIQEYNDNSFFEDPFLPKELSSSTENEGSATFDQDGSGKLNYWQEESFEENATPLCYKDKNGKLVKLIHENKLMCNPGADLFSPCENLMGNTILVLISWIVAWLAVLGNFFVVFMLLAVIFDRSRAQQRQLSVTKFLILNLAISDFCMGIYILSLDIMDSKSNGQYYKYGVEWQTGGGCDVFGFLSIFASQLSVFTLSVISLERWYAIRYAIQLDKRLTLKGGRIIMLIGWCLCLFLASLPLVGINSYRKTAICLPMDVENTSGKAYVALLLSLDIVAFLVVVGSYLWMYMIVRTANGRYVKIPEMFRLQQKKTNIEASKPKRKRRDGCFGVLDNRTADARVAKRMAVLVFTDFACFFPICFFSLFALAGLPLVSMSTAKIVLVFCYPFNACCNPFLYAFLTQSFRNDVEAFIKSCKRYCWTGDDRHKFPRKRLEKRSDAGSRQEERRKTIQLYVDGDAESPHGESGFPFMELKNTSSNTKLTLGKLKRGSCASSNSRGDFIPKSASRSRNSHESTKCKFHSNANSSGYVSSPTVSEKSFAKRLPWVTVLAGLVTSVFKRKNGSLAQRIEPDYTQHSFETQTTAATAATTLCDKTENELSEAEHTSSKDVKPEPVPDNSPTTEHCKTNV